MANDSPSSAASSPSESQSDETLTLAPILIPGLPNDVASLILAFVPYPHLDRLKPTCKSWRTFLSSRALISLRHGRALTSLICLLPQDPAVASPYLLDPAAPAWCPLPPAPADPHRYGLCNFAAVSTARHLIILGGSSFDNRSFPLGLPSPANSAIAFDFHTGEWTPLAPMISPRGSFACAVTAGDSNPAIFVAGGGSRHALFGAAGSRICAAERYDWGRNEWVAMDVMPGFRAGCVGFFVENEFRVLGGYGEARTVWGVFPVDEYCRDSVAMGVESREWRVVGEVWGPGERVRNGKIVVVDEEKEIPGVYMLDGSEILRYDIASNRWCEETHVPREAPISSTFGLVASNGELHIVTNLNPKAIVPSPEILRSRPLKKTGKLHIQIYHPKRKTWRSLVTKSPFDHSLDFNTAVLCNIRL